MNIHATKFNYYLLPPANEVWAMVMFSEACVRNTVHWGMSASVHAGMPHTPPRSRHPPRQTPPGSRHPQSRHPLEQTLPPLGADTPQSRHPPEADHPGADTSLRQTPPRSRHPLGADTSPRSRHPSGVDTPLLWQQTPPSRSRHPLPWSRHPQGADTPPEQTPPRSRHIPCKACWEIRSMHEQYASYWNATCT